VRKLEIDIVHYESFYTAFYISDEIKKLGARQVYGSENIEFRLYEKYAKGKLLSPLINFQVKKIKDEEIAMYLEADLVIGVTDDEVEFIKRYAKKSIRIPNGIDIKNFEFILPSGKTEGKILFVGNFTYFPNIEAINTFYGEVFKFLPETINLTVVGKRASGLKIQNSGRVKLIDFIPDIKDAYRMSDILISPITSGGGTNFKVLEAMAAGVPVIAFGDRAKALEAEHGKQLLVANDSKDFKIKIEKLLSDLSLRQKLALSARKLVEEKYSWESIGKDLSKAWESL
jgi:glycosyltransferase involved in cell wall biosynthesis